MVFRMSLAPSSIEASRCFFDSMPARYRAAYDSAAAREHAAIAARRGGAPARVEVWRTQADGVAIVCVAADDRPGLLSLVSASVRLARLDVVSALAFTRTVPGGGREAFDMLWLRRDEGRAPLAGADAARVERALGEMISGSLPVEAATAPARPPRSVPAGAATNVTFDEGRAGGAGLAVLTVETFDRPGLLLAVSLALFRAGVQIVAMVAVTEGERVFDRFTVLEIDGSPIGKERRGAVQIEVLEAIHALARGG